MILFQFGFTATLFVSALIASNAIAEQLNIEVVSVKGRGVTSICDTAQVAQFGNQASIVFQNFGVTLLAGAANNSGLQEFGDCEVRFRVDLPENMFIESVSRTLIGGVVKSFGARGLIRAVDFIIRPQTNLPALPFTGSRGIILDQALYFNPLRGVMDPLLALVGQKSFTSLQSREMCRWTRGHNAQVDLVSRISVAGARQNNQQSIIIEVDSNDIRLDTQLVTGRCQL